MKKGVKYYEKYLKEICLLHESGLKIKEIAEKIGLSKCTISKYLREEGYKYSFHNKTKINSYIFSIIDTEEKAYWLGFLYADGYVGKRNEVELSLAIKDEGHVDKFKKFLSYEGKITYNNGTNSCRVSFRDTSIHISLVSLGCLNNKSLTLRFPTEEQMPKHLLRHFIRGYFDGDGSVNKSPLPININILGTYEFLQELISIIDLNISIIKKDKRHKNNTYYISLNGDRARNFCNFIYTTSNICLERKYIRFQEHLNRNNEFKRREAERILKNSL